MGGPSVVQLVIAPSCAGQRLDRALATSAEAAGLVLSRSRIAALIAEGAVTGPAEPGRTHKARPGETWTLVLPPPADPEPQAEAIPLAIVHEDADLIVVDKPAGMVVHPAPGAETGTLVNALLAHCGDSLAGIGGERRPGIVHRIDKDTSGLLVAAKTEAAHAGLSAQFAAHTVGRTYHALCWGQPDRGDPRLGAFEEISFEADGRIVVDAPLGRHPHDRKRMAVRADGRRAVSRFARLQSFGLPGAGFASLIACTLETGRTHQIRVHAAHIGHPLVGDATYARPRAIAREAASPETADAVRAFPRQALHARTLAFEHPVSGAELAFHAPLPADFEGLLTLLRRNS